MRRAALWLVVALLLAAPLVPPHWQAPPGQALPGHAPPAPGNAGTGGDVIAAIRVWSLRYGIGPDYMVGVARCESGLDPAAYNPATGATGIFQFTPSTYYWLRDEGLNRDTTYVPGDFYERRDLSSVDAQAHVATWAFAHGYGYLWSCR